MVAIPVTRNSNSNGKSIRDSRTFILSSSNNKTNNEGCESKGVQGLRGVGGGAVDGSGVEPRRRQGFTYLASSKAVTHVPGGKQPKV